jgi:hypothetical protein
VVNFYKCKPLALRSSSFVVLKNYLLMKSLLALLITACVLYFGRETETTFSIIHTPSKTLSQDERATPLLFDMSYQRGRVLGTDLVIIGHDVLESQFVALRLPMSAKMGDTLILSANTCQYQGDGRYVLQKACVVIEAHDIGASDSLVGVLQCQLETPNDSIVQIERRINVVF